MSTGAYPGPRLDRATAQRKREAALARLTRVRGGIIVAAGALTAAVAGVVSAASGHTLGPTRAVARVAVTRSTQAAASAVKMPPLASAGQLGLGSPGQAPQPAPAPQATPAPAPQATPAPQAAAPPPAAPQAAPAPAVSGGS